MLASMAKKPASKSDGGAEEAAAGTKRKSAAGKGGKTGAGGASKGEAEQGGFAEMGLLGPMTPEPKKVEGAGKIEPPAKSGVKAAASGAAAKRESAAAAVVTETKANSVLDDGDEPGEGVREGPISLDGIIGQRRAIEILRGAVRTGRVHHAWIFSGPRGVGKFTTARAFAATLLSTGESVDDQTRERIVGLVQRGTHPDVHVIRKELAKVSSDDAARRSKQRTIAKAVVDEFLLKPAALSRVASELPQGLAGKVFIVDEAELMDPVTQNQVLKTLEEPAEGTVIILVTSDESRLLATVRSRCQRVSFGTLTERDMQAWMQISGVEVEADVSPWLLRFAAGSPGAALVAIEHGLYQWHSALDPALKAIEAAAMTPGGGTLPAGPSVAAGVGALMSKLVEDRAKATVEGKPNASKEAANQFWCKRMLGLLADRWRVLLRRAENGEQVARCSAAIELIRVAERQAESNVQIGAVLENLAAQLMTPSPEVLLTAGL
ncbi:MAG: hypothetical protein IBJ18_06615 [Phycisphaerales bacterium]|nr:hypothetical protein [Phycisphaerales bacterium]